MAEKFAPELIKIKSECWQSRWRPCAWDESGRPTAFVPLTTEEMMMAAAVGKVSLPDSQLPASAIAWRERQEELADV